MKTVLTLFAVLIMSIGHSQVLRKKEQTLKKQNNSKIINASSAYKLDQIFGDNEKSFQCFLMGERPNKNTHTIDRNYIIQDEDGSEYMLKKNEYVLDVVNNNVYTFIEDYSKDQRTYLVYKIKDGHLEKESSLSLSLSSTAFVLKNGDIIITEGGHSGRDWAALYSKELKQLHIYKPFNDESNVSFDSNENYTVYVGQIDVDPKIRIALYGTIDNKGLITSKEIDVDSNLILSSVKVVDQNITLLFSNIKNGTSQILLIDRELNELKKIPLNERVAHNKIISLDSMFYVNTRSKLAAYEIEKGEEKWALKKQKSKGVKTKLGHRFRGSNIYVLDNNHLVLQEATYEDGAEDVRDVRLKVINSKEQKVVQEVGVDETFKGDLKLKNLKKEVVIYGNKKTVTYEKQ